MNILTLADDWTIPAGASLPHDLAKLDTLLVKAAGDGCKFYINMSRSTNYPSVHLVYSKLCCRLYFTSTLYKFWPVSTWPFLRHGSKVVLPFIVAIKWSNRESANYTRSGSIFLSTLQPQQSITTLSITLLKNSAWLSICTHLFSTVGTLGREFQRNRTKFQTTKEAKLVVCLLVCCA